MASNQNEWCGGQFIETTGVNAWQAVPNVTAGSPQTVKSADWHRMTSWRYAHSRWQRLIRQIQRQPDAALLCREWQRDSWPKRKTR